MSDLPFIVKVQRPIAGGALRTAFLVYDRERSLETVQSIPRHAIKAMGADHKAYFRAKRMSGTRCWFLGERIEDQPW